MESSIGTMVRRMAELTDGDLYGVWLYGSVVLDDFRLGWSDIDFIALTGSPLDQGKAERLLGLRQRLSEEFPENPYFRLFEGVITSVGEYRSDRYSRLVYWGTSGQRITDRYERDPFSDHELAECGRRVFGTAPAPGFIRPERDALVSAVRRLYEGIRRCAVQTDTSLYSCGWLLDIARCMYTLRRGGVVSKTRAGEWALEQDVFPDGKPLSAALAIRRSPLEYKDREDVKSWLCSLGPVVMEYADVLERELEKVPSADASISG